MDYKFKLEETEYLEGSFKRKEEIEIENNEISTSIGGQLEIGSLNDRETDSISKLALKIKLEKIVEIPKTKDKIAEMKTGHILIYDLDDKKLMEDIKNNPDDNKEIIRNMINTGYLSIKEYIESSFSRAKIPVKLPFILME